MLLTRRWFVVVVLVVATASGCFGYRSANAGEYESELVFPLDSQHNHAPGIVQFSDGTLFVSWYRGSGERKADDVAVYGAWKRPGGLRWSEPEVIADQVGFPDCNTALYLDREERLWLFWPTIIANSWESCLTRYRVAKRKDNSQADPFSLSWEREGLVLLKPNDFTEQVNEEIDRQLVTYAGNVPESIDREIAEMKTRLGDPLYQRLGWQPRCKPIELPSGRLLLPLYTDTFSISIMAISDDSGASWYASRPLVGLGNIQPSVLRRNDGTLVAYMRENGMSGHMRVSESVDEGLSWGPVYNSELPNPGSGLDGVRLQSGHWVLVYNDTVEGRSSLAISLSDDEGKTWKATRHLEQETRGSFHYPAVIEGTDGRIHAVYSYFVDGGKSMKHVSLNPEWILGEAE